MPDKTPPPYDRENFISSLLAFYNFLSHLPPSTIKHPPKDGWPSLTPSTLSFLLKSPAVIDLIRHLPFISHENGSDPFQIYEKTVAIDFTGSWFNERVLNFGAKDKVDPMEEETVLPGHVLTLAKPVGGRDGFWVFVDTERGTVSLCDLQVGPKRDRRYEGFEKDVEGEYWSEFHAYSIGDFFDMMRKEYEDCHVVPKNEREVVRTRDFEESDREKLKEIYKSHGWPREGYQRETCMEEIAGFLKEIGAL